MDPATLGGLVGGFAFILMSMVLGGSGLGVYFNIPSLLMVIGGSYAAVMVSNPLPRALGIMKYVNILIKVPNNELQRTITSLVNFAEKARREGLLALEDDAEEVGEEFLRKGIRLVVDGTDPEIIKTVLYTEVDQIQQRHETGIKIFDDWGKLAPAFGMIGTLAGLIAMLANLDDPDAIGSGMALALITTMYGSIFANLVLIPFKNKLEDRDKEERLLQEIMVEGILSIQAGDNPTILKQKLLSFLDPRLKEEMSEVLSTE
ncbi:MAG: motility protein A [Sediminispirochaetaceae bacterium]